MSSASTKDTKAKAGYRKGSKEKNCHICRYMHNDGTCTKVQGIVSPTMVCNYFAKK